MESPLVVARSGMSWADALRLATKSAARRQRAQFLVERLEVITQVLAAQWKVIQLFTANESLRPQIASLCNAHKCPLPPISVLSDRRFARLCYRKTADIVAVVQAPTQRLSALSIHKHSFVFVLDELEKPGNIGAILRSAAAIEATALISLASNTDWFNPNVVRNSLGACFQVPLIDSSMADFVDWAKQVGLSCLAAEPNAATPYWNTDLCCPTALLLGNEHRGLHPNIADIATQSIAVPMHSAVNSLNVAEVATLIAYEARRQQKWIGKIPHAP